MTYKNAKEVDTIFMIAKSTWKEELVPEFVDRLKKKNIKRISYVDLTREAISYLDEVTKKEQIYHIDSSLIAKFITLVSYHMKTIRYVLLTGNKPEIDFELD